jgi:two-component system phosphate regulon sensor histidine kinase PhoR
MMSGLLAGSEGHNRGFQRIVYLLVLLVIVPTALLLVVGIGLLAIEEQLSWLFGILVVTLVGCLVTGGVLSLVFLRREAKLSKLQLDFVSKVSHELRTPLTSIRMFAEMLQSEDKSAEETEVCLRVLQEETLRLSERIERLLDWGRMEAGRRVYELRPDTVRAIVDEAVEAFAATQVGRPLSVEVEVEPKLPDVIADRGAVVDALVNLLSNAVKYSGDDKRITLHASGDQKSVRLVVCDNGIGIPRAEHKRIFQKFYRVDERLSRAVEGSGLGLAIVRHVAFGHGGHVEVDSEPVKGSKFTIVLPRPTEEALREARFAGAEA